MERKLLLLGLLRQQDLHGYQLNDIIDTHIGSSIHFTKPTAYRLLHNMAEGGWVTFREEKAGRRPTRRIYALTPQGEVQFQKMLKQNLSKYEPAQQANVISLAFLDALPQEDVIALLEKRRDMIVSLIQSRMGDAVHGGSFQLLIDHQKRHLQADLDWLTEVIKHINSTDWDGDGRDHHYPPTQLDISKEH
jgi:DNA-binding PadR family transcriptional regulator